VGPQREGGGTKEKTLARTFIKVVYKKENLTGKRKHMDLNCLGDFLGKTGLPWSVLQESLNLGHSWNGRGKAKENKVLTGVPSLQGGQVRRAKSGLKPSAVRREGPGEKKRVSPDKNWAPGCCKKRTESGDIGTRHYPNEGGPEKSPVT